MGQTPKPRKYEVRTFKLTEEDLARAKQLVADETVSGQVIEWRDKSCKGLVLRITPTTTQWYLRFRDMSVKLESWMTVEFARKLADMAKTARRIDGWRRSETLREELFGGDEDEHGNEDRCLRLLDAL